MERTHYYAQARGKTVRMKCLIPMIISVLAFVHATLLPVHASAVTAGEAEAIARQAFVYGFAPVLLQEYRQHGRDIFPETNRLVSAVSPGQQLVVHHASACLDLEKEPLVLCLRESAGAGIAVQVLDAYGNTLASSADPGAGCYAVTGPGWKGKLPQGATGVVSPTRGAWIFVRALVCDQEAPCSLTPLSRFVGGMRDAPREVAAADGKAAYPLRQVLLMDMQAFFGRLALFMKRNPPPAADAGMVGRMARIGVDAQSGIFDTAGLSPEARRAIGQGMGKAMDDIRGQARDGFVKQGQWAVVSAAPAGKTDHLHRSAALYAGLGEPLAPCWTVAICRGDDQGRTLGGDADYVVRFEQGAMPLDRSWWSLSVLGADFSPLPAKAGRTTVVSPDAPAAGPDGVVEILVRKDLPDPGAEPNRLGTAGKDFTLVLKRFLPDGQALSGGEAWPVVKKVED